MASSKIEIFIVEDHPIMREGLSLILSQREDLDVCGVAEDVNSALKAIGEKKPQLVLVDISLKNSNGLDLVKMLKKRQPEILILVLSMHEEAVYAQRALRAGAHGYLMKHEDNRAFMDAIDRILEGKIYVSDRVSQQMLSQSVRGAKEPRENLLETLSDRELEVFQMIGSGLNTKKIAESLFLSPKTVESYKDRIKEKLNLKDSAQLVEFAVLWRRENPTNS